MRCLIILIIFLISFYGFTTIDAATVSGTAIFPEYQVGDIIIVLLVDQNFTEAGYTVLLFGPAPFSIYNVSDGSYRLIASVQEDLNPEIKPGEIFCPYSENPIIVENNQNIENITLEIRTESISGEIIVLGSNPQSIIVAAMDTSMGQGIFPSNLNMLSTDLNYNMVGFIPGSYYIVAFSDVNGNRLPEPPAEPFAFYSADTFPLPTPVVINEQDHLAGFDITLSAPTNNSFRGEITWDGSPQGPVVIMALTELDAFSATSSFSFIFNPGNYQIYVDPGDYYLFAFVDVNRNIQVDLDEDAIGYYSENGQPALLSIAENMSIDDINIALTIHSTGINPDDSAMSNQIVLWQNYPNPFSVSGGKTYFEIENEFSENIKFEIFNASGQYLGSLNDYQQLQTQRYQISWDGTNQNSELCPPGVYFYRISTPQGSVVKKMVLLP